MVKQKPKKPQKHSLDNPAPTTPEKEPRGKAIYVLRSKCGYEGDGELIGEAFGDKVLVKIDHPDFNKIITVKKTDLKNL